MPSDSQLPYSAPEDQGIASSAILAFVEAAERTLESLRERLRDRLGPVEVLLERVDAVPRTSRGKFRA